MRPHKNKIRFAAMLAGGAVATASYFAFKPGIAYAEPRFADMPATPMQDQRKYAVDIAHCNVSFEIVHLGLSKCEGRFNKFSGVVFHDAKDLTKSRVEFTIDAASIDTNSDPRDAHIRKAEYFDVEKHPTISFKSTKVEKKGSLYVVTGDLSMKGESKEISIPFKHVGPWKMNQGDPVTRIGVMAEPIVIKRSDFGIGNQFKFPDGTEGASDEVTVRISFEAINEG